MSVQEGISAPQRVGAVTTETRPPEPMGMWKEIWRYRDNRLGLFLVVPSVLALVIIQLYPTLYTIWLILTDEKGRFYGLKNFQLLFDDPVFWDSLVFSFKMALLVLPGSLLLGLGLALLVQSKYVKRKAIWISIFILPVMVSEIVVGVVWRILYHPTMGLVNFPLTALGGDPIIWLEGTTTAWIAISVAEIWRQTPLAFLLLYAGLSQVPREIYEAAAVDGAGRWKVFRDMTIPYLRPMLAIAVILIFVWSTRTLGTIVGTTNGGPGRATWNLTFAIYGTAFRRLRPHYASAEVAIMLLISWIVGTIFVRYLWVERKQR